MTVLKFGRGISQRVNTGYRDATKHGKKTRLLTKTVYNPTPAQTAARKDKAVVVRRAECTAMKVLNGAREAAKKRACARALSLPLLRRADAPRPRAVPAPAK